MLGYSGVCVLQRGSSKEKREYTLYWQLERPFLPLSPCVNSPESVLFPLNETHNWEGTQYLLTTEKIKKRPKVEGAGTRKRQMSLISSLINMTDKNIRH